MSCDIWCQLRRRLGVDLPDAARRSPAAAASPYAGRAASRSDRCGIIPIEPIRPRVAAPSRTPAAVAVGSSDYPRRCAGSSSSTAPPRARSRTRPGCTGSGIPAGRVIYVGKAKSLRQRLNSYFADIGGLHPRTAQMVTSAGGVEWTVVSHRGRGAAAGIQLDQGVRPAVQRPVPGRQVVPGAGRHRCGEEFPRLQVMRGAAPQGRPLLRAVRARLGDPRDAGPAAAGVPRPHLLGRRLPAIAADRPAVPARATSASARRRASAGSPPRSTARSSTTSATSWPARPTR